MPFFGPPTVAKLKEKRDVKGLIKAIGYQMDPAERMAAARALGEIRDARAVEPLIAVLKNQREFNPARRAAAWALADIGAPAVKSLVGTLGDKSGFTREYATEALVEIGGPSVEPLIAALGDRSGWANMWGGLDISKTLGKIGIPAVEPLIAALRGQNASVRMHAAWALGWIGDNRAVEPLIAALGDQDEHVREAAAEALGRIGDVR